jgi:hypothetical protein
MADWYATFPAASGAQNISIHLVVNESSRTSSSVTVSFALYIERTVGTGFWAGTNNGNQATVTIDGQTYTYNNYTYDFRSGSGTFRQFTIGSGSKVISSTSIRNITVSAQAVETANPPGTATIGGQSFTITPSPAFTDSTIASTAIRDVPYSDGVAGTSVVTFSVSAAGDSLPTGLSINGTTGAITGTPTVLQSRNIIFRATNASGFVESPARTLTINPPAPVFTDSTVSSPAIRDAAYTDGVAATDVASSGGYSISEGSLPTGLSLNTTTGAITGTPTVLQNRTFKIRATNSVGVFTDTSLLSIDVNPPTPVFTDEAVTSPAIRGVSYTSEVFASDTTSYSVFSGALPTGLSLNTTTGAITGTPTTLQTATFTIRSTNVTGTDTTPTLSITVNPPAPVFTDSTVLTPAVAGVPYTDGVSANDAASYSVFSGSLPTGLSLNTSTGAITGTPTVPGVFTFVLRATNVTGNTDTATLTITVLSSVKVWDEIEEEFITGVTQVWDGSSWKYGNLKVWDGIDWVTPS